MPPVIKNGLVPRDGGESAAEQGNLGQGEAKAEVAARPQAVELAEPVGAVVGQPARAPAHRVQLARALADAVVAAIEVGDAEGAKVAVGMLEQFVGMMVERK